MRACLFAGLVIILVFGCVQTREGGPWDYEGKLALGKGVYILEDFDGRIVFIPNGNLTGIGGGATVMVRGEEKREWRECEEFTQCKTGWFEYFEVSEFEVFEWNDVERQCNSMKGFENWTNNCSNDARCAICPDTIMTSSVWCHAREYCEEIDKRAQSDFVK